MRFEEALPRLIATYEAGELVPFLGAGMSVPTCPDWAYFIAELERIAETPVADDQTDAAALVRRANRAVRALKLGGEIEFPEAVREALAGGDGGVPPQTEALARTWWPLVLTTNYDGHFHEAFRSAHRLRLLVRGRSPGHCQDVLTSLSVPSDPILWTLQGFLPPPGAEFDVEHDLAHELVVGHEEYRRVTHREQHFRKAFAEVFRRRSFLFLGSGLQESYLLELFGEILEFYGTNPLYHYALVKAGEVDAGFLLARFNTIVVEYGDHAELPGMLDELDRSLRAGRPRVMRWDYSLRCDETLAEPAPSITDLTLLRGRLPPPEPSDGGCVGISGGLSMGRPALSAEIRSYVRSAGLDTEEAERVAGTDAVWRYGASALFGIVARTRSDQRDVRTISRAVGEFCDVASAEYRHGHLQLLGAGSGRIFPARFSLIEMVRGFAAWRRANPGSTFQLIVHVIAPDVLFELATERIDVLELLTCQDVRFWVEIPADREVERHLEHCPPSASIQGLAERFGIPRQWGFKIVPAPRLDARPMRLHDLAPDETVETTGVVPGSTVRFSPPG